MLWAQVELKYLMSIRLSPLSIDFYVVAKCIQYSQVSLGFHISPGSLRPLPSTYRFLVSWDGMKRLSQLFYGFLISRISPLNFLTGPPFTTRHHHCQAYKDTAFPHLVQTMSTPSKQSKTFLMEAGGRQIPMQTGAGPQWNPAFKPKTV